MGEPVTDPRTGKETDVPVSQAGAAVAAGDIPAPAARIPVVVDDGSVQTIAAGDLQSAMAAGWKVASPEEVARFRDAQKYETAGAQARAAGEAALRGLTIGLSDEALTSLGVDAEGLLKRRELNPVVSTAGELGGAIAPLLLTGGGSGAASGAGALARTAGAAGEAIRTVGVLPRAIAGVGGAVEGGLSRILGEGILARGASMAGGAAVEGGLYGLGQAVSESALKDIPLTSERILAHVGTGALWGAGAGGVLGTTLGAAERVILPKVKELFSVERLQQLVDRAGLRQWAQGRGKSAFKKLRRDFGDDAEAVIGRAVRDEGLDEVIANGSTWDEINAITKDKLGTAGRRIGEDLRAIDQALPDAAVEAVGRVSRKAQSSILEPLERSGLKSDRTLAKNLRDEFGWLWPKTDDAVKAASPGGEALAADLAAAEAHGQFVPSFEELHKLRARIDDVAYPKGFADPTPQQKALQQLRGIVEEEITTAADAAADRLGGTAAATYSANKQRYRVMKWLNDAAENNAASELANRTVSLTDNIWGSSITGSMLTAALSGDMGALGSMALATFAGTGAALLNKYLREQGQGLASRVGEKILALQRASESTAREADRAVGSFFKSDTPIATTAAGLAGGEGEPLIERFEKRGQDFQNFLIAPEARMRRVLGDTDQTAPAVAQEVRAVMTRAAQFLDTKYPRRRVRDSDVQAHLDKRQRVSDSEMARFLRYADAVEKPKRVIADFARGKVSREGAEALRVVYPRLHQQLVEGIERKLAESTERLPRAKLVQLSILLDKPLDPSMEPGFIAMCQQVHAQAREQQKQGLSPGQRQAPTRLAGQEASASQQIEGSA